MLPKIQVLRSNVLIPLRELILGFVVALVWWPIFIPLTILNVTLRSLVQLSCNLIYGRGLYFVADGEDSVFGYRIKNNCNSLIAGYQVIKGTPNLGAIRKKFFHLLCDPETSGDYARLRYRFTSKFGYYCWKLDETFDIRSHIRIFDHWDVRKEADEGKLMDMVGDLVRKDMDLRINLPQWEVLLIPKYRDDSTGSEPHFALITRFNHSYSDAISFFLMLNKYISDEPAQLPMDPTKLPFKIPFWAQLIIWGKAFLLGPYSFVSIMSTYIKDESVFRIPIYSEKKLCGRSKPFKMETLRRLKNESGTSVTSLLYTAVYSALNKCHRRRYPKVPVPQELHLGSVMAMFPYWEKRKLGNQFTLWPYTAPLSRENESIQERLTESNGIVVKGMGGSGPLFNFHLSRALGSLPKVCHTLLWCLKGSPVMLSNVPGFSSKLKIYGGEMTDCAGFMPLMSTVGIGLATQTYCGDLRFNCIVDPKVFRRRPDLEEFLDDIVEELEELARIYKISEEKNVIGGKPIDRVLQEKKEIPGRGGKVGDENGNQFYKRDVIRTVISQSTRSN